MRALLLVSLLLTSGCGSSDEGGGSGSDRYAAAREECVATINAKRASLGKPPYARWKEEERCVDGTLEADFANAQTAHWSFSNGQRCGAFAQNTCPGWPSVESISERCLEMMWAEGPGEDFSKHGHYLNMSSDRYTHVACGFYETDDGKVWASQNFK